MKGFKHTGRGPKMGHSFSSKAGFSGSTGRTRNVRGYTQGVPKFAAGGMVVAKGSDGGSALTRRAKPVTGFDAEAGGKGPLRPGFNKGGEACYAEGGKVATTGAAIKMMKELMKRGNSAEDAASKAARRYGVSPSAVKVNPAVTGGGGLPADKQLLARGGRANVMGRIVGRAAPTAIPAPRGAKAPVALPPAPQSQKVPMAPGRATNHMVGYGSFGRRPVVG